ncbi:MAG: DUF2207 domain-containing protein [Pseudolysinimonas sp.]|uniref:DUF2207 domain-containing protein n=1 Tax=Pseudolysinimonas sp. TaxID=2680009 RepID=UPI003267DE5C
MSHPRRLRLLPAFLALVGLSLAGCAPLPTPAASPIATGTQTATETGAPIPNVQDFQFTSFNANYQLSRDAAGRSVLLTTERLVAKFPEYDQNRGIKRDLPTVFNGHPTDLEIVAVTDARGRPIAYDSTPGSDALSVVIAVPAGQYVHGEQTYVIVYQQHSVIGDFGDGQKLTWDVNGTQWGQPFGVVSARIEVDAELAGNLIDGATCSYGLTGSTHQCDVQSAKGVFSMAAKDLGPGASLTFAIPFMAGTFSE